MKSCNLLLAFLFCGSAFAQQLAQISGNGQLVFEQNNAKPLIVRAVDAAGKPIANLQVDWSLELNKGTLRPQGPTDADGYANAIFLATSIQPGTSWDQAVITASSAVGTQNFFITTIPNSLGQGASVSLLPVPELRGAAGSTIREAFTVVVAAGGGIRLGQGIPNIGVRAVIPTEADPSTAPGGVCEGNAGTVLTDERGRATCNLILNRNIGLGGIHALVGDFNKSSAITLIITAPENCNLTLPTTTQNFPGSGGTGSFSIVSATPTCSWTAASTASWITVQGTPSGSGNGTVSFAVAANTGAARTGTITVGNSNFTVAQAAQGSAAPISFATNATLPAASANSSYSLTLSASGGQPPFTWTANNVPAGLSVSGAGLISGTVAVAGTYQIPVTVRDSLGSTATQTFTLVVNPQTSTGAPLSFVTSSFASGVPGTVYQQGISVSGGCANPFGGTRVEQISGTLPPGLLLQSAGSGYQINGTPTTVGTYPFALRATDACGNTSVRDFTIQIGTVSVLPSLSVLPSGLSFSYQRGGTLPVTQPLAIQVGATPTPFSVAVSGAWLSADLSAGTTPTSVNIRATPGDLAAGTYAGSVTITAQAPNSPVTIPVTLTVTAAVVQNPTLLVSTAPLNFASTAGAQVPAQQLQVNATGPLNFTAAAGTNGGGPWLIVSPNVGASGASVSILADSAGLSPGQYTGNVTITPSNGTPPAVVLVRLTVSAPGPRLSAIVNGASFQPGPVAPGEIVTIRGTNIGPAEATSFRLTPSGTVDTLLSNVRVWFDDQPAPLLYASGTQINVVVPYTIGGRVSTRVFVENNGVRSEIREVPVGESAPGIFTAGGTQGAILNQDATANNASNGAQPGSIVVIYATGEGISV
ncbi:MAG: hypothetical protein H7Y20_06475, partial [Bryobacteraceae bacterium]|nr:hypothetical protein [Bryobacteraceae bacterium]